MKSQVIAQLDLLKIRWVGRQLDILIRLVDLQFNIKRDLAAHQYNNETAKHSHGEGVFVLP
ncbi:hypothetical protein [Mechercharimyces sp. CAU 1602]|uniref:hypothetical protein n=1 Tax=Mechercharimyces sp. CAU 1602 TaxID=2973933 RepID=UPI002163C004|nr:hypothetical protein [Mechercharimyces sp. CAU 1602]MCS1351673.1 hypothetical protein [Mechercharimyces sp. CAU 1602]